MKRILVSVLSVALLSSAGLARVQAGQGEWATVGKILTGVVAASVITRALNPVPVYYAPPVVVVAQPVAPVYFVPPPVVYSQPVYYSAPVVVSAPVYYSSAPVYVVAPTPVYYAPRPVFGFHFRREHSQGHHHHRGGW